MQCPNCQNVIPDTANVCGYCGNRLKSALPAEAPLIQPARIPVSPVIPTPYAAPLPPKRGVSGCVWGILGTVIGLIVTGSALIFILPKIGWTFPSSPLPNSNQQPGSSPMSENTPTLNSVEPTENLQPVNIATSTKTSEPNTPKPPDVPETLMVEPFDPASSTESIPILPKLDPTYEGWGTTRSPGAFTWSVKIGRNQSAILWLPACATTRYVIEGIYQYISFKLTIDNQPVDLNNLYYWETDTKSCRNLTGIIRKWSGFQHTVIYTMTYDRILNNGWVDRPAGDYIDIIQVTVIP